MKRDLMSNHPVTCNYIDPLPILHVFHVCIHSMKHTVTFHSFADSIATLDLTLHIIESFLVLTAHCILQSLVYLQYQY